MVALIIGGVGQVRSGSSPSLMTSCDHYYRQVDQFHFSVIPVGHARATIDRLHFSVIPISFAFWESVVFLGEFAFTCMAGLGTMFRMFLFDAHRGSSAVRGPGFCLFTRYIY